MKKKIIKIAGLALLAVLILLAAATAYLTVREYRPQPEERIKAAEGRKTPDLGQDVTVVTYNTGYAGLSKDEDFFMDGGTGVRPDSKELIQQNLQGIASILKEQDADAYFLQEVDRDSKRSYYVDEQSFYEQELGLSGMFACNFKCDFVPYPLPPIGKVESGLVTMTGLSVKEASRISLPESFKWPVKTCNLKRCMLESRVPVEGTDKELVLINFHLEAYDSGAGKLAQSRFLAEKLALEYEKGNYVIAGGDFNQTFDSIDAYPVLNRENWVPGTIGKDDLPDGFSFAVSAKVPTCRLLDAPYSGNYQDSQVYVLDGFIVSDNLKVLQIENIDTGFAYSDHQPVCLRAAFL